MKVIVTYEDGSTDSHYQMSSTNSDITNERFAWRFAYPFGGTVPTLSVELFNAETGASILTDDTATPASGTWHKSIDGGSNWIAYDADDRANDITYIRYTPTNLTDDIIVRAVLTQE
jgi:hypothetical protein